MSCILVTGATGATGSHVARELVARDQSVRAFVRDPDLAATVLGDDLDVVTGDLADPTAITIALKGVDAVFLACANSPRQVECETNVIDAAVDAGVGQIVKLSALNAAVGSPLEFWDANARIEQHVKRSGLPYVILQPSFAMTNLLGLAESIKQSDQFYVPAAGARISMIDPRDVAAAAAVVLTTDGRRRQTYRLTGRTAVTFSDVAEELSTVLGRSVQYVSVPDEAARGAMVSAGLPEWIIGNLVTLYGLLRRDAGATVTDDFRKLTGREPRGVDDFLRDHAAWFGG